MAHRTVHSLQPHIPVEQNATMTAWLVTGLGLMSHDRNAGGLVILEVTHVIPFCYESYKDQEVGKI